MDAMKSAVIDLAMKHLGDYRIKNNEIISRVCPFCGGGDHNDYNTFAVNMSTGLWNCRRGSCSKKQGNFKELCEFFGEANYDVENYMQITRSAPNKRKTYDKPDPDSLLPITDEIVTFFGTRKISEETLKDWKIAADDKGNIVFPFYRDGVLTYVKYRKPKKHKKEDGPKEWQMANTEPILYGMDNVSYNKPLVICEGEIDALSLYEAGVTNVVSVPCGCQNLEWVNICWEWLEAFSQIVLFGDADEPGIEMVTTLLKRLGEDRCMIAKEYPELIYNGQDFGRTCKDANEILMCYGPDGLKQVVDSCEAAPIKGILNLADVPFVDMSSKPKILTKIPELDYMIGGLMEGGVTIFSGKRGEGKSTVSGTLALNAIQEGRSVCAYSGELPAEMYLEWIMLQATESKYISYKTDERTGKNLATISPTIQKRIRDWINNKFYLYDNSCIMDEKQEDSILKVFEACARRYGCTLFIMDNLMSALTSADEENKAQAKFMARLKAFASKYKVHVIVVAHPRKEKADSVFTNDSVSGSSVINSLVTSASDCR